MSKRILRQQLSGILKSSSSPASSDDKPSMKLPVVKKGIGKVKNRIKSWHRQDRADKGVKGTDKSGFRDAKGQWVHIDEEGILGTFNETNEKGAEERKRRNLKYFQALSLTDGHKIKRKSKLHVYHDKEAKARKSVLSSLAACNAKPKRSVRSDPAKARTHDPLDDEEFE